jgi:hypothetical protein
MTMSPQSRFFSFFSVLLLLIIFGLCWTEVRSGVEFSFLPLACAAVVLFPLSLFFPRAALFCLAGAVVILPFFGNSGLSLCTASWLLGRQVRRFFFGSEPPIWRGTRNLMLLGLLVLVVGELFKEIRALQFEYDPLLASTFLRHAGIRGSLHFLLDHARLWNAGPLMLSTAILAVFFFAAVCDPNEKEDGETAEIFVLGLAAGTLFSIVVLVLQLLDLHPALSFNRSAFWMLTGRYGATFSDPNAFGVAAALLVPLFLHFPARRFRGSLRAVGSTLFLAAMWSGSRTFWLGMGIWLIWRAGSGLRLCSRRSIVASFVLASILSVLLLYPRTNEFLQQQSFSPGISRMVRTLNWQNGGEMFRSRVLFSRIALEVWREQPLAGAGMLRFYQEQDQAAKTLGIELGSWRDNANNYYLQALCEGGLIGLLCVAAGFGLLWAGLKQDARTGRGVVPLIRFLSLSLFVLLLTGPHVNFDEIRFLFAGLLGIAALSAQEPSRKAMRIARYAAASVVVATAAVSLILLAKNVRLNPATGVYAREQAAEGTVVWTGEDARLMLCPARWEDPVFSFQALNPDIESHPLELDVIAEDRRGHVYLFRQDIRQRGWQTMPVSGGAGFDAQDGILLKIKTGRVWRPRESTGAPDDRWLGVMLKWPSNLCPNGEFPE